tara:strand:+ start:87 stop:482 length:396 start_codon:yes stop_codon:yes gene_type:complete
LAERSKTFWELLLMCVWYDKSGWIPGLFDISLECFDGGRAEIVLADREVVSISFPFSFSIFIDREVDNNDGGEARWNVWRGEADNRPWLDEAPLTSAQGVARDEESLSPNTSFVSVVGEVLFSAGVGWTCR